MVLEFYYYRFFKGNYMRKVSEILGKNIISLYEGKKIGIIENVAFDKKLKKLKSFIIYDEDSDDINRLFVPSSDVKIEGENAVMISNLEKVIEDAKNLLSKENPMNASVYNLSGTFLGKVKEVLLYDDKKDIYSLLLTSGAEILQTAVVSGDFKTIIVKGPGEELPALTSPKKKSAVKSTKTPSKDAEKSNILNLIESEPGKAENSATVKNVEIKNAEKSNVKNEPQVKDEPAANNKQAVEVKPTVEVKPAPEAKLTAESKPATEIKSSVEVKQATEPKPTTETKPAIEVKSAVKAKPAAEVKPKAIKANAESAPNTIKDTKKTETSSTDSENIPVKTKLASSYNPVKTNEDKIAPNDNAHGKNSQNTSDDKNEFPLDLKKCSAHFGFLIGRRVDDDIYNARNEKIVKRNTIISNNTLDTCKKWGKLIMLARNSVRN